MDAEPPSVPLVRYQGLLWAVSARVRGTEGLFLVDTAAGVTTLDRGMADRLGVAGTGRFSGSRMSGEVVALDLAEGVEIEIGPERFRHETVGIFDLSSLLPGDWPYLGGAIALPTFAGRAVTLDFAAGRLVLETPASLESRVAAAVPLTVRAARDGPSLDFFVEARAPGRSLWLELDTGNTGPVILAPGAADALGLDPETSGVAEVPLDLGAPEPTPARVVVKPIVHDGVVGVPFLAGRVLTLSVGSERAWLSPA